MDDMNDLERLTTKIKAVMPYLDERSLRIYLASEARALGKGGIETISEISGKHRNTISAGIKELDNPEIAKAVESGTNNRIRKPGGGRKPVTEVYPDIKDVILSLVNDHTYGNPENPLTWTTKSLRKISEELKAREYKVNYVTVGELLVEMGFSLQLNQKMYQVGKEAPDRDEQFEHINSTALEYMQTSDRVISIDCKKKENIGNFTGNGAEYRQGHQPVEVLGHPLQDKDKAVPYDVYDIANNEGHVNVGVSSDTAEFAVQSIRTWWNEMGKERFPKAKRLYITADGGGSNGSRCKLWKTKLQTFADEINIPIEVSHFPPGTAKWNKIEHRMFSQINKSWEGRPPESMEVIVRLIASTTTEKGVHIESGVDNSMNEAGIKVSDEGLNAVNIVKNIFQGEWNYTIFPWQSQTMSE